MNPMARVYHGAAGVAGPLLFLKRTPGAIAGEWVSIQSPGQPPRRGQVIDAGEAATVVQVLDETLGLAPGSAEVTLAGEVASVTVGRELLGRALTGSGAPLDGLPVPVGEALAPIWGTPMNPVRRVPPADFIETGISAIDGMNTLVRGQKLPVFAGPGLPALDLAARIVEWARAPHGEPFAVVFAGIGITARETRRFLDRFERAGALERSVLYSTRPAIPPSSACWLPVWRWRKPSFSPSRPACTCWSSWRTSPTTARRSGRLRPHGSSSGRRGFPGYMYSDLASLFERAGILRQGRSVTQIPVLTMPDDDITDPIPDLTGYITEGQVVLGRELHRRGIFPPVMSFRPCHA